LKKINPSISEKQLQDSFYFSFFDMNIEKIIKDCVPQFYFHPEETSFPCSIDDYLQHVDIASYKYSPSILSSMMLASSDAEVKTLAQGPFTQATLSQYAATVTDWNNISLKHKPAKATPKFIYGPINMKAPTYVNYYTKNGLLYINYTMFYGENVGKLGFLRAGEHQADVEFVTLEINKTTLKPVRVLMSCHGADEARWSNWSDVQKTTPTISDPTERLKVYVALGSHGNHAIPGKRHAFRIVGLGNDSTDDSGLVLLPTPALFDGDDITITIPSGFNNTRLYLNDNSIQVDNRFMQWKGALGANSVHFPNSQDYFRNTQTYGAHPPINVDRRLVIGFGILLVLLMLAVIYFFFQRQINWTIWKGYHKFEDLFEPKGLKQRFIDTGEFSHLD
jgi:hypothetical protein